MFVEVPVSSIKTSRLGSSAPWPACQATRAAAISGRSCSLACTIFFKADALGGEKPPHRAIPDNLAAAGELATKLLKRQVCSLANPLQQPLPFLLQARAVVAAHRPVLQTTFRPPRIHPLNHRADRHLVPLCRLVARQTALNRPNNPFPQVLRIWSSHAMLAPSPASSLNHILRPGGIPFIDSSCSDTALTAPRRSVG